VPEKKTAFLFYRECRFALSAIVIGQIADKTGDAPFLIGTFLTIIMRFP
jgi:hypothetical protein